MERGGADPARNPETTGWPTRRPVARLAAMRQRMQRLT
jgi:hypothetical protein